ncbi:aspartyl protease AED1-like [Hordeum vulgare subsp. vulgare]|uniref:aspartyl protease AED1-like n=1 Tax=Hordeum vulgare subsp. vulgare TaxID=112509 RepID=UPI001D1A418B|nr:aspartyl protease AED1-like [Hordeum vulgare subsp. vulgare]
MASPMPSLLFCLLVLAPHLGSSSHTSFINGGKRTFVRSSDPSVPPTCSPTPSGEVPAAGRLPVMHRLSPCSPSGAGEGQSMLSAGDAFDRDSLRLRALFGEVEPEEDSKAGVVTIPATGAPLAALPGAADYSVVVGFGTPVQKLAVGFDTATVGATLLQCKPCSADGDPCDKSFDPSRSRSLAQIPCASRDCPLMACSRPSSCAVALKKKGAVLINATVVTDTLTVSRSVHADDFRFACLEMGAATTEYSSSGVLDLSRERHSLASRVAVSPDTVAFSYCLPADPGSPGFLSLGATRPELSGRSVVGGYATVWDRASHPNLYFLRLVGVSVGVRHLHVPPAALATDALLEVHATFNYLSHHAYAALRHEFRELMREYRRAPPVGELETCYDFTGLRSFSVPMITLRFHGGADLVMDHVLYFKDPRNVFGVACLAFAPAPAYVPAGVAVVGSMAQANMEVVYDVRGGKVGFVPNGC